jgi:hypothetical protein
MRKLSIVPSLLVVLALASACAPPSSKPGTPPARGTVITTEEVRSASGISNAFDLVQSLRPAWLRNMATDRVNATQVVVYLDDTRLGGPEALRQIAAGSVTSVQRLDSRAAQFRFGSGHTSGAIVVSTR